MGSGVLKSCHAVGYRRCSTSEQAESGLGLAAQLVTIESIAARLNVPVVAVHDDAGVSGALPLEARPGLLAAINQLARGDVLCVARRDRLGRDLVNVALIERLVERRGARIVSPDAPDANDPAAQLLKQIVDCFSQYERLVIKARTKSAMAAARARGQRVGWIPYGSRLADDGVHLVRHPEEQAVLEELRQLRRTGYTLRAIAATLNDRGLRNRYGRVWRWRFVQQLLDRHP